MSIEELDTIFIVTCGLPAGARQEDTQYILSWLKRANYERCIKIHTAVVLSTYLESVPTEEQSLAYSKSVESVLKFYKEMAIQNGGEFFSLTDHGKVPLSAAAEKPEKEEKKEEPKKEEPKKEDPEKKEPEKQEPEKKEPEKKEPEKKEEPKKEPEKTPKKGKGWLPGGG